MIIAQFATIGLEPFKVLYGKTIVSKSRLSGQN
jgi:hypothetical protein